MRRLSLLAATLAALAGPVWAETAAQSGLFACRVIVTGTDERSRPGGLERCVRDVIVKATGEPGLAGDERIAAIAAAAPQLVEDIAYLDRMTDIPKHDEQGTRDRPFDLIAHVDPVRLGELLAAAGLRVWTARPALLMLVSVEQRGTKFSLSGDGALGERQRQALLAAGERFGMRVMLPTDEQWAGQPSTRVPGAVPLRGALVWSEADFGWNAEWRLETPAASWSVRGVSFDQAFRSGVGGAAERLSR